MLDQSHILLHTLHKSFFHFSCVFTFLEIIKHQFSLVTRLCPTLWDPMDHSAPGLLVHHQLLESTHTHLHWVRDAIQPSYLCHPLLLLLSVFPSIRVFSDESALHIRWLKYWIFSFNISPSNEHSGLISFRMDWLDLLAVQGTLKSLPQYHSSKASILRHSAYSNSHIHTWLLEKPQPWLDGPLLAK